MAKLQGQQSILLTDRSLNRVKKTSRSRFGQQTLPHLGPKNKLLARRKDRTPTLISKPNPGWRPFKGSALGAPRAEEVTGLWRFPSQQLLAPRTRCRSTAKVPPPWGRCCLISQPTNKNLKKNSFFRGRPLTTGFIEGCPSPFNNWLWQPRSLGWTFLIFDFQPRRHSTVRTR